MRSTLGSEEELPPCSVLLSPSCVSHTPLSASATCGSLFSPIHFISIAHLNNNSYQSAAQGKTHKQKIKLIK